MLQCSSCFAFLLELGNYTLATVHFPEFNEFASCFIELATVPLYITELVPPKDRGILSDATAIFVNVGYVSASYVGVGFF
jgi:hypothetical protein